VKPVPERQLTATECSAIDELCERLNQRIVLDRIVVYFPEEQGAEQPDYIVHLAIITEHYPPWQEHRAALGEIRAVETKYGVTFRPLFSCRKDWETYFPLVAAFAEIRESGLEVWRRR
jgi:hypothetical protein